MSSWLLLLVALALLVLWYLIAPRLWHWLKPRK